MRLLAIEQEGKARQRAILPLVRRGAFNVEVFTDFTYAVHLLGFIIHIKPAQNKSLLLGEHLPCWKKPCHVFFCPPVPFVQEADGIHRLNDSDFCRMRVTRSLGHVRQRRAPDACHALLGCSDFRWSSLDDIVHALVILERVNSGVALVKIQPRNMVNENGTFPLTAQTSR